MDALLFSINAVFPLLLLSALGFYIKQNGTINDEFLKCGNKFCFKYGFWAMMFTNIYKIENLASIKWNVVIFAVLVIAVLFFIGLIYVIFFIKDSKQKGVVHQAFYRSNYATIGLPLAFNIAGNEGLVLAALISAFSVPAFNILAVISLSVFKESEENLNSGAIATLKKHLHTILFVLRQIATNPLILGVLAGLVCVAVRPYCGNWRFSTGNLRFLYKSIEALGSIAPWFSLILLGGQFKFSSVKKLLPQISASVIARLIFAPILGMLIVIFLPPIFGFRHFENAEYAALFALFATPEAVASVAMADQMDADSELAGQILVWTAFFSMLTLFAFTAFFKHFGFF